jgi:hypothetical protein
MHVPMLVMFELREMKEDAGGLTPLGGHPGLHQTLPRGIRI